MEQAAGVEDDPTAPSANLTMLKEAARKHDGLLAPESATEAPAGGY
jgi:hypothetical protein